ncbi:MAG: chorismate-binding protein [Deltaproteobacteria bacterium]|nr:chorismate-binding protein [Deltaproteobacteria bacterium]
MSVEIAGTATLRADDLGLDPMTAFARLRTYTPGRAAFLLESLAPDADEGRYSIVGYRVRSGEVLPPGVDAVAVQAQSFEARTEPASFAASVAEGAVGFFSSSSPSLWNRVRLFEDEGPSGMFALGATVVVFDHHEGSITIAGPAKGRLVDRCLWELQHGPDPAPLPELPEDALPDALHADVADEKLQARAARARAFVSELEGLVLARTFTTPTAGADAFHAYRALRQRGARHGFYLDFGESPLQARLEVFGTTDEVLLQRRHGEASPRMVDALRARLPHARAVGAPGPEALRLLRQLEDASRQAWGGAVGLVAPGGGASLVLGDELVTVQHGSFWCTAGAPLDASTDPLSVAEVTRHGAAARLRAIAVARATVAG